MREATQHDCFSAALCQLGEGPVWHAGEAAVYWFDVIGRTLYRKALDAGAEASWPLAGLPGCMAFRRQGGLLMAFRNGIALSDGVGRPFCAVPQSSIDFAVERINDGAVDREGRFWFGTFSPRQEPGGGALYRLDPDLVLHRMDAPVTMSNGIAWSPDDRFMYFVDSFPGRIWRYPFDAGRGSLGERELFIDYGARLGIPDGCCVDSEGRLWVAEVNAGTVSCYAGTGSPDRAPLVQLALPVTKPTSVAFGGPGLSVLFVTTEWNGLSDQERRQQPLAGATFRFEGVARGVPLPPFAG